MLPPPRPAAMQIARCPGRLAVPPPDDLRGRHFVRRWCQSRWPPGEPQSSVQPVAAASQGQRRLVLGHAPRRRRRTGSRTCDDRFSSLNATFAEAASERRGPRRVQAVVAQCLPGIHAPVVAVGQKRRPRELSWRSWKRSSTVPLVGRFKGCSRIQARVGQRRFANGLGGIGVIIEIEVAGSVSRFLLIKSVQSTVSTEHSELASESSSDSAAVAKPFSGCSASATSTVDCSAPNVGTTGVAVGLPQSGLPVELAAVEQTGFRLTDQKGQSMPVSGTGKSAADDSGSGAAMALLRSLNVL